MEWLAERLANVEGVVAVALGGSRAQGTERPESDWDFGLYYRGSIDPGAIRALGYPGTVSAPGEWAYPMNGGAWLTVDGRKVDILYRDLDDVLHWTAEGERGRWELYRVPGYLCGMASYMLTAELGLGRVLLGRLPKPDFPEALRTTAPRRWRWEAEFAIRQAEAHARRGDVAACIGKTAFAVLAEAHARLCERAEWIANEKGLADKVGLAEAEIGLVGAARHGAMMDVVAATSAALRNRH